MNNIPNNPYPVRLKELKNPLREKAMELDRSLHWLIVKVLREYVETLKKEDCEESKSTKK